MIRCSSEFVEYECFYNECSLNITCDNGGIILEETNCNDYEVVEEYGANCCSYEVLEEVICGNEQYETNCIIGWC